MDSEDIFSDEAKRIIKSEMAVRALTYKRLSKLLAQSGYELSPLQLMRKVNRGAFTFSFVLRLSRAMDMEFIPLHRALSRRRVRRPGDPIGS